MCSKQVDHLILHSSAFYRVGMMKNAEKYNLKKYRGVQWQETLVHKCYIKRVNLTQHALKVLLCSLLSKNRLFLFQDFKAFYFGSKLPFSSSPYVFTSVSSQSYSTVSSCVNQGPWNLGGSVAAAIPSFGIFTKPPYKCLRLTNALKI